MIPGGPPLKMATTIELPNADQVLPVTIPTAQIESNEKSFFESFESVDSSLLVGVSTMSWLDREAMQMYMI